MLRRAEARALERAQARDPASWGVSAQILHLPTAQADVSVVTGVRGEIVAANRSDPFDLLHRAGSLTDEQHRAARRLMRDWCLRAGVRDRERLALERVDGGRPDPSGAFTDSMLDAGGRISEALKAVGHVNARLFEVFFRRLVDEASGGVWRVWVTQVTGITNKDAQGPIVVMACEALRMHYAEVDAQRRRDREEREARQAAMARAAGGGAAA